MTIKRLLGIIGAAILILVINVAISFLYVAIYSYTINPGHPAQYYQEYAQIAAPYVSIIAGMPLFFFVCRWVAAKWEPFLWVKTAVLIWLVYALMDVTVSAIAGLGRSLSGMHLDDAERSPPENTVYQRALDIRLTRSLQSGRPGVPPEHRPRA